MGKNIKCVVWDLDNTLWNGVLSEGDPVEPDNAALELIRELDRRGFSNPLAVKMIMTKRCRNWMSLA